MSTASHDRPQAAGERGRQMYELIERLYPLWRSITGDGVRQTLAIIGEHIPLHVHEVPSGTQVFDWEVPNEWNIRDAYVKSTDGRRVIDCQSCNLHVVSYSVPVRQTMSLSELRPHLHSLPEYPDWIPYRTSYYKEGWGFCLSDRQLRSLKEGTYEVVIDSSLGAGSLTYGEYLIRGATQNEVLIFSHICHPSLCNDNLSGIALTTLVAEHLSRQSLRYSYRLVLAPATIGSITWLSRNEKNLHRIKHGLVVSGVGDPGRLHYKKTRSSNAEIDRVVMHVLKRSGKDHGILDFEPYGYDERQFCSPGINLPVGRLTRTPNGRYDQYHTSADDLGFVSADALADSFATFLDVVDVLEHNVRYVNTSPKGEPRLGKRGLYRSLGGYKHPGEEEYAMLWVLNQSDGEHSLLDIAERSGLDFCQLLSAAKGLETVGLLRLAQD